MSMSLGGGKQQHWGGASHRDPETPTGRQDRTGDHHVISSSRPHPHTLTDAQLMKYQSDERFFPFFGHGNKFVPNNTYARQEQENYVLPDAYEGSNHYLKTLIIHQVQAHEMWGTSLALPWKEWDGMQIDWDEWEFADTMMTRTPEEAVSRMLRSRFDSHRAYTVRYGIALIMEHGFFDTDMGRQHYALQLIQIRNAICVTAQYGVVLACLNPPRYYDEGDRFQPRGLKGLAHIRKWFEHDFTEWACINRHQDGWIKQLERMDTRLKTRNQEAADLIIIPSEMQSRVMDRPELKLHLLGGSAYPQGALSSEKMLAQVPTGGKMIVESLPQRMGDNMPANDPTYQEQTTGNSFYMLGNHLEDVPLEEMRTSYYDIIMFSEDNDEWFRVSYKLAVRFMGLYTGWDNGPNKKGDMPLTPLLGRMAFPAGATWGLTLEAAGQLDRFVKQLMLKPNHVYNEFAKKFILADAVVDKKTTHGEKTTKASLLSKKPKAGGSDEDESEDESDPTTASAARASASGGVGRQYAAASALNAGGVFGAPSARFKGYASAPSKSAAHPVAEPAAGMNPQGDVSDIFSKLQLRGAPLPKHKRLTALIERLAAIDSQNAAKMPHLKSNLKDQVVDHAVSLIGSPAFIQHTKNLRKEAKLAIVYTKTCKFASDLMICQALQTSTLELDQQPSPVLTALEHYVLKEHPIIKNRQWGAVCDSKETDTLLTQLNEQSPYWRPMGAAAAVNTVSIICPEKWMGDKQTNVRRLKYTSQALTLSSSYIVLFNIRSQDVNSMLTNPVSATLFSLSVNFNETTMPNSDALLDRLGVLQFSIILSSMFTTLATLNEGKFGKKKDKHDAFLQTAKQWIKLAVPEHMLTHEKEAFKSVISLCSTLPTLPLQDPLDPLIHLLRDALVLIYTHAIAAADSSQPQEKSAVKALEKEVVHVVEECNLKFVYFQKEFHTIESVNEQVLTDGGETILGLEDPTLTALFPTHKSFPHGELVKNIPSHGQAMEARRRNRREKLREDVDKLNNAITHLRTMALMTNMKTIIIENTTDVWKPTYLRLVGTMTNEEFTNLYLPFNEFAIHAEADAFKSELGDKFTTKFQDAMMPTIEALLLALTGSTKLSAEYAKVKDEILAEMIVVSGRLATNQDSQSFALEWTRLWTQEPKALKDALEEHRRLVAEANKTVSEAKAKAAKGGSASAQSDAEAKLAQLPNKPEDMVLVAFLWTLASLALTHLNLTKIRDSIKAALHIESPNNRRRNEKYQGLFLYDDGQDVAKSSAPSVSAPPPELVIDMNPKESKRIEPELLKAILKRDLPMTDGYFWQWSIENDMVQAIGGFGESPHCRYDMGTVMMLSAYGKTGNTFHGKCDMMLSDNAATKMHYGHFTYQSKSVILVPKRLLHGRNVICRDYLGGNGHLFWDATDPCDKEDYEAGLQNKSIFMVPVLMNHQIKSHQRDITGSWAPEIGADEEANKAIFHSMAPIYSRYWGWRHSPQHKLTDLRYSHVRPARSNTIVFQSHQFMWDHGDKKFSRIQISKGPWGDRIYPGCAADRTGRGDRWLKPTKWQNTAVVGIGI